VRARLSAGQDGRVVIKDGIGLFLAIYLPSSRHWDPGGIGVLLTTVGFWAAFLFPAGCALAAFLLLWIAMRETRQAASGNSRRTSTVEPRKQNKTTAPAG
jgi:hypothetical protein